ncbi:MAG TPA: DUF4412 domain-containing protein [Gemmatimonadaceae bacterium]|jgi:hypothetical protein
MSNRRAVVGLLSSLLFVLPVVTAHAQFEGAITMHVASGREGGADMTYLVKGSQMRIDIGNATMSMFMLAKEGEMTMVMPAQKIYFAQPVIADAVKAQTSGSKYSIKPTGKMETIAGYKCEHYTMSGGPDGDVDACLSKDLGTFMRPINPMGGRGASSTSDDVLTHLGGNVFPLKVAKVGGATTLEVTKIEKKPLDAGLFTVPSDFKKLDINAMRGGRPPQD